MTKNSDHVWRPRDPLEIPPSGDVVIREPREGWSREFYKLVLLRYFVARGVYPRTARMHPSTERAITPTDVLQPV